jgi:hypothetical protein
MSREGRLSRREAQKRKRVQLERLPMCYGSTMVA